ncbi:MAG TPA: plastocyanin/azurin family copper-binding protein [Nitrososphaeraceae archaeon]|nr:plastocyanin/azurin family copper-binding protein [Nitrososphaeraceae archaeon]
MSSSLSGSYTLNPDVVVTIPDGAANDITQHFVPNPVNIDVGDTIELINEDTTIHTVNGIEVMAIDDIKYKETAELGLKTCLFDSNILYPGDTFYYTFDREGIYNYICIIHPYIIWTINVQPFQEKLISN